ncbi:MAG: hypothetical protein ACRDPY_20020 [Streptosporangiaceae bacterium]
MTLTGPGGVGKTRLAVAAGERLEDRFAGGTVFDSPGGRPRPRVLGTIREFVAERLAARPDAAEIERRHAGYYRALAGQGDRPLRGAGQNEWLELLQAEAGNLAAAVRWYLAHDPAPLPHLFRALFPWWSLRDRQAEARPWVEQLLPLALTLAAYARLELAEGDPERAARLAGAAQGLRQRVGLRAWPMLR